MIDYKEARRGLKTLTLEAVRTIGKLDSEHGKENFPFSELSVRNKMPAWLLRSYSESFVDLIEQDSEIDEDLFGRFRQDRSFKIFWFTRTLVTFVCEYFYEAKDKNIFDETAFVRVFGKLRSNWHRGVHEVSWWIALENLHLDPPNGELQLSERVSILQPAHKVFSQYVDEMSEDQITWMMAKFPPSEHSLFLRVREAYEGMSPHPPITLVNQLLFTLRLVGGGTVYPLGFLKVGDVGRLSSGTRFSQNSHNDTSQDTVLTEIETGKSELVRRLFQQVDLVHSWYHVAATRYLNCTTRGDRVDILIDAIIGLESVLLPESSSELSYRFRLNGALLLASSSKEAESVFSSLKEIYNVRSKIVHGGDDSYDVDYLYQISKEATEFLQKVLFIIIHESFDSRKNWDKYLAGLALMTRRRWVGS